METEKIPFERGTGNEELHKTCQLRIAGLRHILADREAELFRLKGPCSNKSCSLHYAHSGPCNGRGRN